MPKVTTWKSLETQAAVPGLRRWTRLVGEPVVPLDSVLARSLAEGRKEMRSDAEDQKEDANEGEDLGDSRNRDARPSKRSKPVAAKRLIKTWAGLKEAEMALRAPKTLMTYSEVSESWPGP